MFAQQINTNKTNKVPLPLTVTACTPPASQPASLSYGEDGAAFEKILVVSAPAPPDDPPAANPCVG